MVLGTTSSPGNFITAQINAPTSQAEFNESLAVDVADNETEGTSILYVKTAVLRHQDTRTHHRIEILSP